MKKNVLYTVTKGNRPAFMPGNEYSLGSWIENTTNKITDKVGTWFGGNKLLDVGKPTMAGSLLGAVGIAGNQLLSNAIGGKYHTGVGDAIGKVGGTIGGMLSKANPILGTGVSLLTGALGGLYNSAMGVNLNEDLISSIKNNAFRMKEAGNALAQTYTNDAVMNAARNMGSAMVFDYHDLGSTGWARTNRRLKREENRLNKEQDLGLATQIQGLMTGVNQADQTQDDLEAH